jgi:hypothetical protein
MAFDGEAIRGVFTLVTENPEPPDTDLPILASTLDECCQDAFIHVYFHEDLSPFKNDKTTVLKTFSNAVNAADIVLQKFEGGAWVNKTTITSVSGLGDFYAYGFLPNTTALTVDWFEVFDAFGIGAYRLKFIGTIAFGGSVEFISDQYCLARYNPISVDGTVRLEWYMNGTFADLSSDKKVVDFKETNLYFSLRLDGIFGKPTSEKEEEFIQYQSGQEVFVKSTQTPDYTLLLKPQTFDILQILQYYVFQQDLIIVTDYNRNNHHNYINKEVKVVGGFAPQWDFRAKKAPVTLQLTNSYNNFLRKL